MFRWDIINYLINRNEYKSYLEIGYYKGWSFDKVDCEYMTAVDPNPSKTRDQESAEYSTLLNDSGHKIFKLTSDDYFKSIEGSNLKYDIIFIDGLHESEQVYRDIENSLKHLSDDGIIVMHDCNPPLYEHTTTGIAGCWTGDTYKAVLKFNSDIEHTVRYRFQCVDTDWGVGIIRKIPKQYYVEGSILQKASEEALNKDWDFFDKNRQYLLSLISIDTFKEAYI